MINPTLQIALEPIVRRERSLRRALWTVALLSAFTLGMGVWKAAGHQVPLLPSLLVAFLAGYLAPALLARRWSPDYRRLARSVERRHPELASALITAIDFVPEPGANRLDFLRQRVVTEVLCLSRARPWSDVGPNWSSFFTWLAVLPILSGLLVIQTFRLPRSTHSAPPATATAPVAGVEVTPGDVEIERGTPLIVTARFGSPVPTEATLVLQPLNETERRQALVRSLDDPVFAGALTSVEHDLRYRIEYGTERSREYGVSVFDYPRIEQIDATIQYPPYVGLADKALTDTRRISLPAGAHFSLRIGLNKPMKTVELVANNGNPISLTPAPDRGHAEASALSVSASTSYEVRATDAAGRTAKVPTTFTVDLLPNKKPELKLLSPRGDVRVSPLEELTFRFEAWDDFGLVRYGLTTTVGTQAAQEVVLGSKTKPDERVQVEHQIALETLGLKPDEAISWFAWAEDVGPDQRIRRTTTNLFFAEVRPFEEIYRAADDAAGGGEGGGPALKLAELEKEIISATWNLMRGDKTGETYQKDEGVIGDSQHHALEQARMESLKAEEPKAQALYQEVIEAMGKAHEQLKAAQTSREPLDAALTAEQAAYNTLLKLAAHEFRIARNQSSQGRAARPSQQAQLNELEMKDEKKRYEKQSEAESPQNEQKQEQLALLNQLKELATRQQDINARLKELQSALQAAQTEEQKAELQRQLKRLREEEQQLLADLDEARQKMEQSPRSSEMAGERQQLEQTRQDAQQTAEAMQRSSPSQALASGARTAQQLEQMRDQLRKKASAQFDDAMRQMRGDARDLAEQQKAITESVTGRTPPPERRSLDGLSTDEKLGERLAEQTTALNKLSEQMKSISEQAEGAEPLLSRELYDAVRKSAQADTNRTLEMTKALAERGYLKEAGQLAQKAQKEIDELKAGVEKAAETVLGDEAEALRQARAEVERLARQVEQEPRAKGPSAGNSQKPADPAEKTASTPSDEPGQKASSESKRTASGRGPGDGNGGPLTGDQFVSWSDGLRNVEEMLDSPDLRSRVATIREAARGVRAEYRLQARQPDWDFVRSRITQPLVELRNRLTEELARRESPQNLVPVDREPVPPQYAERVRLYYENLSRVR